MNSKHPHRSCSLLSLSSSSGGRGEKQHCNSYAGIARWQSSIEQQKQKGGRKEEGRRREGRSSNILSQMNSAARNNDDGEREERSNANADINIKDESITTSSVFSLDSIRRTLIRQEETIIFALIERAQFRSNSIIYMPSTNYSLYDEQAQQQSSSGKSMHALIKLLSFSLSISNFLPFDYKYYELFDDVFLSLYF
jgi:hypothetical protein